MFIHLIDPVFLRIGPLEIRYYGLIYVLCFILGYFILRKLTKDKKIPLSKEGLVDYMLFLVVGTIIGARIFYCLVYNPMYYLPRIWEILYIWKGGLSFHGGFLGAALAIIWFSKSRKISFRQIADLSVIPLALGLALGRIANFINGELVGTKSTVPWCVQFKYADGCRHPSQIYASIKNLIIFTTLWFLKNKAYPKGTLAGIFIIMYAVLRFIVGFFRAPDVQIGYIGPFTLGQLINILLLAFGIGWLYYINKYPEK